MEEEDDAILPLGDPFTSSTTTAAKSRREAFQESRSHRQSCKSEKSLDFDDLLHHVGEFGKYQQLLVFLICLPACIPCGFHAFNQLFMSPIPPHWCRVPELEEGEEGVLPWPEAKELSIPFDQESNDFSRCLKYDVNFTALRLDGVVKPNSSWPTVKCDDGWNYNTTVIYSSIVIDYDLVCERTIYPTIGLSLLNVGGIFGVYLFGVVSDKCGRRVSFLICLAVEQVFGLATAFAPNFWVWTTFRFMVGLTIPAIYQIPFIISLELVGPNYRSFVTVMTCLFYVGGMILLSAVAYFVRNWVHLCLATSLPFFLYIVYWWVLPESPRWLLSQGRMKEAHAVLEKMAQVNGTTLPVSFVQKLQTRMISQVIEDNKSGFLNLWKTPNLRLKTILITFTWIANETVYVGLSYYGPALGNNEYISFFLSCVVEVPSYLLCWIVMDHWGRRWILGVGMIVGGFFAVATVLMPEDNSNTTLALYLISKFAESAAFLIIYPFGAELYPTEIRGIGIGFSAYMGGLGLVAIPFINHLGSEMLVLPLLIMGILSVVGGLAAFRLPETLQQKLPNTIEEGEEFGKEFSWKECCSCIPNSTQQGDTKLFRNSTQQGDTKNEVEELSLQSFGEGGEDSIRKDPTESTPLQRTDTLKKTEPRRGLLIRQTSVMETPIVTDATGAMKITYWF